MAKVKSRKVSKARSKTPKRIRSKKLGRSKSKSPKHLKMPLSVPRKKRRAKHKTSKAHQRLTMLRAIYG